MVYTILISIVFIAETIIAITIIQNLLKLDKAVINLDETVYLMRPSIKDVAELCKNISEQMVELAKNFVYKFKKDKEDLALKYLSKLLMALLLLKINSKVINKLRKSKTVKFISKGLSLLENMV